MAAAEQLVGINLNDGWLVVEKLVAAPNATGGMFSHSYLAKKDGRIAFVKAFDFSDAFKEGVNTLQYLAALTHSYENERDILQHCRGRKLSKVATAIGDGDVQISGLGVMEGRVYYLVFERADGDIRRQMDEASSSDLTWCMRALRDVCLGLAQVHREMIAHQDLKPSNVLCYESENAFKVADFGKSSRRGVSIWHDEHNFPGDRTYAPLELLYGHLLTDFHARRVGADMYMLGNLAAFLFTGTNVTSAVLARMDRTHHWTKWAGPFSEVLPYVLEAFARVLEELEARLPAEIRAEIIGIVKDLCTPDISARGHRKNIGKGDQYSLERYVAQLTHSVSMLEVRTRIGRRSA